MKKKSNFRISCIRIQRKVNRQKYLATVFFDTFLAFNYLQFVIVIIHWEQSRIAIGTITAEDFISTI